MRKTILLLLLLFGLADAKPLTPYNQGYDQGRQAGRREGEERGRHDGRIDGEEDGYHAGYQQAVDAFYAQAQQEAYQQGSAEANRNGTNQGGQDGQRLGREEGLREGAVAGRRSADETALKEVEPGSRAAGVKRAEAATPRADGDRDGRQDGLKRAQETAKKEDYPKGQESYRSQRFSEPVSQTLQQRQSQLSLNVVPLGQQNLTVAFGKRSRPHCDFRYLQYPSDNEEFQKGFRRGYESGFINGYDNKYDWYYDSEFTRSLSWGAAQARPGNLDSAREQGYQNGYQDSFQTAYQTALAQSKEQAYSQNFQQAFSENYAEAYPQFLKSHAESIEKQAFENLYRATYQSAFEPASSASFQKQIETERKAAFQRGVEDEKKDFERRPVRVLEAWVTATDVPNVSLVTIKLRNFGEQAVAGHRVHLFWNNLTSRLYHSIPPKSEVLVTGVFKTDGGSLADRDLEATLRTNDKDLFLGKVSVWPSPPK